MLDFLCFFRKSLRCYRVRVTLSKSRDRIGFRMVGWVLFPRRPPFVVQSPLRRCQTRKARISDRSGGGSLRWMLRGDRERESQMVDGRIYVNCIAAFLSESHRAAGRGSNRSLVPGARNARSVGWVVSGCDRCRLIVVVLRTTHAVAVRCCWRRSSAPTAGSTSGVVPRRAAPCQTLA